MIRLLVLATLLAGCATTSSLQPRGLVSASDTAAELNRALEGRRIALVVGVDHYDSSVFGQLDYAGADATAVGDVIKDTTGGGFHRVDVALGKEATQRQAVLEQLRRLKAELLPQDVFVLYFSGHGTFDVDERGGRLYLLPSDAVPGRLAETALDLEALRAFFGGLPADRKAFIVDACFHGQGKSAANPALEGRIDEVLQDLRQSEVRGLGSGEAHLFASTLGRPAFEDHTLGHGVYTHYLLQALTWGQADADRDGDGVISAWEAHDHARLLTEQHTSAVQVPEASLRVVGSQDVVLAGDPDARQQREDALLFSYGAPRWDGATVVVDGRARGAFPSTVPVPSGRHHLLVRGTDGELLVDGMVELRPGEGVRSVDLPVRVREERLLLAVRGGGGGGPASSWGPRWGDGLGTVEAWVGGRLGTGAARNVWLGAPLGVSFSARRHDAEGAAINQGRPMLHLGFEGGWGPDLGRFGLRLGWQVRANLLPLVRLPGVVQATKPEEEGWLFPSTGPSVHASVDLDRKVALTLAFTVQGTVATFGDDELRLHPFALVTAGLEFAP
jgi:uncharacterized caspase-like protein